MINNMCEKNEIVQNLIKTSEKFKSTDITWKQQN